MSPERRRTILALALPTIGGMMSQNVSNLIDTAMVGALGAAALAGVGFASFLNFFAFAAIAGLATAVQATAARRYGEGKFDETAVPLNGGLLLAGLLGVPFAAFLILTAPWYFPLLNADPEVVRQGMPYLQLRLLGITAIGMNFAFRGYWNAINQARVYMRTLIMMCVLNIVLNYGLIFGKFGLPELGTTGAGIGTSISNWAGTCYYFWFALRSRQRNGFMHRLPSRSQLLALLKLGLPSSLQQMFFAGGFAALFWIIGQIGTPELAVANVLVNITLVAVLPAMGFGLAAASLVSHALGRGDAQDAHRWGWDVVKIGAYVFVTLGLPMLVLPKLVLSGFLHEPALLELGQLPLQLMGLGIALEGIGVILMNALLGAGASAPVMGIAIGLQWGVFLPLAWWLGPHLGFGLAVIWFAFILYRAVQSSLFTLLWERRSWVRIRI